MGPLGSRVRENDRRESGNDRKRVEMTCGGVGITPVKQGYHGASRKGIGSFLTREHLKVLPGSLSMTNNLINCQR